METIEFQRIKARYDIVGNDQGLNRAIETALAIAPTDITVLITGESGVGKEVLPSIIHQNSRRKNGKFLAVNCGAIPSGTINAELFGHEKGSFTGAIGERKGYFEEADGGTLFLDEIGELPKETQAMLLRVLQDGEYMKVGSSKVEKTDVRVVAATNVDLSYAVATGKFRQDLYYRLNSIEIKVPALRERPEDIYLLFRKFSSDFAEKYNLCKLSLSHDAITALTAYRWPGNIRQLKNVAEAVTALESEQRTPTSERIDLDSRAILRHLPDEQDSMIPAMVNSQPGNTYTQGGAIPDADKQAIIKAILDLKGEVDNLKRIIAEKEQAQPSSKRILEVNSPDYDGEKGHIRVEEQSEKPMSLKSANNEMMEQCLEKHNGKVKDVAAELGISERTIYRYLADKKSRKK